MSNASTFNARPQRPLWGIRPLPRKTRSLTTGIKPAPLPRQAIIPVEQCLGVSTQPLVSVGDHVLTGQPIAAPIADNPYNPQIHASISGTVSAIELRPVPGPVITEQTCIIIDSDHEDQLYDGYQNLGDPLQLPPETIRKHIAAAGIVGLGGALFSTATKLATDKPISTLILNGAECEPYITCDEIMMRDYADRLLRGAQIMLRALGAQQAIIVVESDMPESRVSMFSAIEEKQLDNIHVSIVTAKYPAGGERQITELVMDREVPAGGLPADIGVMCQNVGTVAAVRDLYEYGIPLIARIVTVTGRGVAEPCNVAARIGTPIGELFEACGGLQGSIEKFVMGGPMMGFELPDISLPTTKATNCVIAMDSTETRRQQPEMPCIRCGECIQVCPARLMPQELLTATRQNNTQALINFGLDACIECGCCDYVCPSQIQLTARFVDAKQGLRQHLAETKKSEQAQARFEARVERLERLQAEEQEQLEQQLTTAASPESLEAIMARARQKDK